MHKIIGVSDNIATFSGPVGVRLLLQRFRLNYWYRTPLYYYSCGKLACIHMMRLLLSYRFGHGAFLLNLEVLFKVLDIYNIIYKLNSVPQLFNKWKSWVTSNGLYLAFSVYRENKFKQIEEKN